MGNRPGTHHYTRIELYDVEEDVKMQMAKWMVDHEIYHWWCGIDSIFIADPEEVLMFKLTFGL